MFNALALSGCLVYVAWRLATTAGMLHTWGFRADNFWTALRSQSYFALPAAAVLFAVGLIRGSSPTSASFWLVFGLYSLFGVVQQFVLQNLIARNLRGFIRHEVVCAFSAAFLFGLSHVPRASLAAAAMVGSFFLTLIYQRHPNLWAVGIVHGLLAALAFYTVLGDDPGGKILQVFSRALGIGELR